LVSEGSDGMESPIGCRDLCESSQHEFLYYSPILVEGLHQHRGHSLPLWLRPLRGRVAPDRTHQTASSPSRLGNILGLHIDSVNPIVGDPKALRKAHAMMSDSHDSSLLQTPKHRSRSGKQHC